MIIQTHNLYIKHFWNYFSFIVLIIYWLLVWKFKVYNVSSLYSKTWSSYCCTVVFGSLTLLSYFWLTIWIVKIKTQPSFTHFKCFGINLQLFQVCWRWKWKFLAAIIVSNRYGTIEKLHRKIRADILFPYIVKRALLLICILLYFLIHVTIMF